MSRRVVTRADLAHLSQLLRHNSYHDALDLTRQLVECDNSHSSNVAAFVLCRHAEVLSHLSRFDEATSAIRESQRLMDAALVSGSALVSVHVQIQMTAGQLERILGRYVEAEEYLLHARDLIESHRHTLNAFEPVVLNELGILYKYWKKFDRGEEAYRQALELVTSSTSRGGESLSEKQRLLAALYHNRGGLEFARGRLDQAEMWAMRSHELHKALFGESDAATVADGAALGGILHGQGRYHEAIPFFERAIEFFAEQFGDEHYEVAVNLNNLAAAWQKLGRLDEAEAAFHRAIGIKESLLGGDHPDVAVSLRNLASLMTLRGEDAVARRFLERAVTIDESAMGRTTTRFVGSTQKHGNTHEEEDRQHGEQISSSAAPYR